MGVQSVVAGTIGSQRAVDAHVSDEGCFIKTGLDDLAEVEVGVSTSTSGELEELGCADDIERRCLALWRAVA